jgi:hypothetical protein
MKLHEITDELPMVYILTKQLLDKSITVFLQRTPMRARSADEKALYPVTSLGFEGDTVTVTFLEHVAPSSVTSSRRLRHLTVGADLFDKAWNLSKSKGGRWVLHLNKDPVTDVEHST